MGDVAVLNVKTNYREIEKSSQALDQFSAAGVRAGNQSTKTATQMRATEAATKSLSTALNFAKGAFIGMVSVQAITQVVQIADRMNLLEARVKNSVRAGEDYKKTFAQLGEISAKTGASLQTTVDVFQRLSFTRQEIGATVGEMLRFTETVQKLGVISGASQGAMDAGLLQLGQSLSAGIVRAEEFNSIMENIPAVGTAIAQEFGISTGQLRNLVINGKVLSEDVFNAILNKSKEVNEQFSQFPKTAGLAFAQLQNDIANVINQMDEASGMSTYIVAGIKTVGVAFKALFVGVSAVFEGISAIFAKAINDIQSLANVAISALNTVGELSNKYLGTSFKGIEKFQTVTDADILGEAGGNIASTARKVNVFGGFESADESNASADRKKIGTDYQELAKKFGANSQAMSAAQKAAKKELEDAKRVFEDLRTPAEEYAATVEKLDTFLSKGLISQQTYNRGIAKARDEMEKSDTVLQKLKQSATEFGDKLSSSFFDAITGAKSFKSVLSDLLSSLAKSIFDQGTGGLLSGIGSSLFSSLMGGGKSGGKSGGTGIIGSIASGITSFLGFADGGVVDRAQPMQLKNGKTAIWGEKGDEAILPLKRGTNGQLGIQNHGGSSKAGNQYTFAPVIDARGADVAAVQRLQAVVFEMQKNFNRQVENAAANKYRRDPQFLR